MSGIRTNAELDGDSKAMPDKGTGTGLNGDTYGADLSVGATNSMGQISSATMSQAAMENCVPMPDSASC